MKIGRKKLLALLLVIAMAMSLLSANVWAAKQKSAPDASAEQQETLSEAAEPAATKNMVNVSLTGTYGQTEARSMLAMVNDFRTGDDAWVWNESNTQKVSVTGLEKLTYDYELERTAMLRAAEIALLYSKTRPNGTQCETAFSSSVPGAKGENIYRKKYSTVSAEKAFTAWQETNAKYLGQAYRRNLLSSEFKTVGIGYILLDNYECWVMEFGGGLVDGTETAPNDQSTEVNLEVDKSHLTGLCVVPNFTMMSLQVGKAKSLPSVRVFADLFGRTYLLNNTTEWSATDGTVSISNGQIVAHKAGETDITTTVYLGAGISNCAQVRVGAREPGSTIGGECGDNLTWTLDWEGTLTISGTGEMDEWEEEPEPWSLYSEDVRSLVVEEGVTRISNEAFRSYKNLTNVTVASSVTSIGGGAFAETAWMSAQGDCAVLNGILIQYHGPNDSIIIPDNVTVIGEDAFLHLEEIDHVTIPNGVTKVCKGAFNACVCLSKVIISDSVKSIGAFAFDDCNMMNSLDLGHGVEEIGDKAFAYCDSLTSLTIPDSVTSIGESAFYHCVRLESVTIPDSVTSIGEKAFGYRWKDGRNGGELIPGFTIRGVRGSAAQTYATENGIAFEELQEHS